MASLETDSNRNTWWGFIIPYFYPWQWANDKNAESLIFEIQERGWVTEYSFSDQRAERSCKRFSRSINEGRRSCSNLQVTCEILIRTGVDNTDYWYVIPVCYCILYKAILHIILQCVLFVITPDVASCWVPLDYFNFYDLLWPDVTRLPIVSWHSWDEIKTILFNKYSMLYSIGTCAIGHFQASIK